MSIERLCPRPVWLPLALAVTALSAHAQEEGLQFNAGYQIQRDSNLFRQSTGGVSDTLQIKNIGLSYEQRYSLQNVQAEVSLVDYEYSRNKRYDLTATNYDLNWDWAVTPQVRGRLYADRSETVNSFDEADTLSTGNNRRVHATHGVSVNYEADAYWSLLGGVFLSEDRSDEGVVGSDDYRQTSMEAGIRRSFGTGSHAVVKGRYTRGKNPNSTQLTDDTFQQYDALLDMRWEISGLTVASASLQKLDRSYRANHAYDYDGISGSANLAWQPSGKVRLILSGSSDLSSYQTSSSTHARTDRVGLQALWTHSPRTSLGAGISESRLRLLGHPAGGVTNPRRDNIRELSLNASWAIDNYFTFTSALVHRKRDSTVSFYDFSGTVFNIGLNASF